MSSLGVKGLEPLLRGADLDGAVVLAEMEDCPEREGVACQYVHEGLANHEKVLLILAQTQIEEMRAGLAKLGVSLDEEMGKGTVAVIDWWKISLADLSQAATRLLESMTKTLDSMGGDFAKRVLITGLQNILASLLAQKQSKFVDDLAGQIRSGASLGMTILDPKDVPEQIIKGFYEPFDGVIRLASDSLEHGYMIGVVTFDGVERPGIYLPVLKSGEEYVAGIAAKDDSGTEACPLCGFQVLPGFDKCPRCKAEMKKTKEVTLTEVDAVFDYRDKLKEEIKSETPEEESSEDVERREKLEEFLQSIGAFEEGGEEEAKEKLKKVMESRKGRKQSRKKPSSGKGGSKDG